MLAASLVCGAAAQDRPQTPTFRASVDYVVVDAIVTDGDGRIVRDLTPRDFDIVEDGKPQTIASFSFVDLPIDGAARAAIDPRIDSDVATNARPVEGRIYALVLDDWHIAPARTERVKRLAHQFVDANLRDGDVMTVVHASHAERGQELTGSRRLLNASIDRLMGDSLRAAAIEIKDDADGVAGIRPGADPLGQERIQATFQTLDTLKRLSASLGAVEGRRKAILLLGDGIDVDVMNPLVPGIIGATRDTLAAAARANVSIYGVHALGLTGLGDEGIANGTRVSVMLRQDETMQNNLHLLSDSTGGFAIVNQNDFTTGYARIVRDSSSYYLIAYASSNADRDGTAHTIDVRVRRTGVTVRARQGYVTQRPAAAPYATTLAETLASPLPANGLPLSVFAAPFRKSARDASVVLGIEVPGGGLTLGANQSLEIAYAVADAQGKIRASDTHTIALADVRAETRTQIERMGLRAIDRLELAPGRYHVRVAARETAGGARGSVFYDLDVPDFGKEPIAFSGVVLTSTGAAPQPTPRFDDQVKAQLRAVLPGPPSAARTFSQDEEVAAFAEAYVAGSRKAALTMTTTVTAADGRELFHVDQNRKVDGDRCQVAVRLPMKDLAPGGYVLTLAADTAPPQGKPVVRRVPFTVTAR